MLVRTSKFKTRLSSEEYFTWGSRPLNMLLLKYFTYTTEPKIIIIKKNLLSGLLRSNYVKSGERGSHAIDPGLRTLSIKGTQLRN
jgi:hypothetical protein